MKSQEGKSRTQQQHVLKASEKGYLTECATLALQSRQQATLWPANKVRGDDDIALGKTKIRDSDDDDEDDEENDSEDDSDDDSDEDSRDENGSDEDKEEEDVSSDCLPWSVRSFQQGLVTATAAATTQSQRQSQGQGGSEPVSVCLPRSLALLVGSLSLQQGGISTGQEYIDAVLLASHHNTTAAKVKGHGHGPGDEQEGILDDVPNVATKGKGNGKGRGKGKGTGGSSKKKDAAVATALTLCKDELSKKPGWSYSSSLSTMSSATSKDTQMVPLLCTALLSKSTVPIPFQVILWAVTAVDLAMSLLTVEVGSDGGVAAVMEGHLHRLLHYIQVSIRPLYMHTCTNVLQNI